MCVWCDGCGVSAVFGVHVWRGWFMCMCVICVCVCCVLLACVNIILNRVSMMWASWPRDLIDPTATGCGHLTIVMYIDVRECKQMGGGSMFSIGFLLTPLLKLSTDQRSPYISI